jgi:hypothetical protein
LSGCKSPAIAGLFAADCDEVRPVWADSTLSTSSIAHDASYFP